MPLGIIDPGSNGGLARHHRRKGKKERTTPGKWNLLIRYSDFKQVCDIRLYS